MTGRNPLLSVSACALSSALGLLLLGALMAGGCAKPAGTAPTTCGSGFDLCGTECVDLLSNTKHCGGCATTCGAGQVCNGGTCGCVSPQVLCGPTCIDVQSDAVHCGGCTRPACTTTAPFCSGGQCSATCNAPNTACSSGCVNTQTNPQNCGACNAPCGNGLSCVAGHCQCPSDQPLCPRTNACATPANCPSGAMGGMTGGLGGTTGAVGGMTGTAGMTGGLGGAGGSTRACAPVTTAPAGLASIDMLSDFEEGNPPTGPGAILINQGTPKRTGWWYVYADPTAGTQTPATSTGAVVSSPSGDTAACNKWSMHSTATNHPMYTGFGAGFLPMPAPSQVKTAYDLTAFDGISFKIKSGGATQPAVYFEVLTKETQPDGSGGNIPNPPGAATAQTMAHMVTDLFNTRGQMINVTSTWTTVYVPFATLIPRWIPAAGGSKACTATAATGDPKCQAPRFVPGSALGIQFSMYSDPGFPKTGTLGTYDLWVDDVMLYKRATTGAPADLPAPPATAGAAHPFPQNAAVNARCGKPAGADGKFLVNAYNQWKAKFVVPAGNGLRVQRPENNNDTVSEGIGYGMLIAVYMNDKALFDGLYNFWTANCDGAAPAPGCLMTWQVMPVTSGGSATDADEDAAFALLMASKQWTGSATTYLNNSLAVMHAILAQETSGTAPYVWGGNHYKTGNTTKTNPSYFAPAWYRAFAVADTGNAAAWNALATNVYTMLNSISGTSANGLYAAWCNQDCSQIVANNDGVNDILYQYDSHRIPWRLGLDYCWNGTAAALTHLDKLSRFFNGIAVNGVGRIFDLYTPNNGRDASGAAVNSGSIIGTAASGAMSSAATNSAILNDGYQFVSDLLNRGTLAELGDGTKSAYSYFNATVGLLTLLTMSGNLTSF